MVKVIRAVLSIVAGLTLAGGLVVAIEVFSNVLYPPPPDFKGTQEEMCAHVAAYPQWILAVVVVAWSATALASTWFATRLGSRIPGVVVGLLLILGVASNVAMLPYVLWFKVAVLLCVPIACLLGIFLPRRPFPAQGMPAATAAE
jgi:uncharacterized membrane protein